MMRWTAVALAMSRCGGDPAPPDAPVDAAVYTPGETIELSAGLPGNHEDPAVLRARDGSLYVAWYSQSSGPDLLIRQTRDGAQWSAPAHITTGAASDLGPSLYQDARGIFHAVWFRWSGGPPG
ncbi:MAG TPA: hypothetical protein VFK02_35580, partial [Kofleriaceae bacterium]|nr:hypothetical protein [Kofleriaceae bacterium]